MERCTIYARFSPRRQGDQCESIEAQLDACHEYAGRMGLNVIRECIDREKSGSDPDRAGLWEAVDGLSKGDTLLVYRLDRLVRGVELGEVIFREIKKRGAAFAVVNGMTYDDSPEGDMVRRILAAVAEYERVIIGIRTKYAMQRHQREGKRMSNQLPYGFCEDTDSPLNDKGQHSRMIECEHEQAVIRRMLELRWHGVGCTGISRVLNSEGLHARGGEDWNRARVWWILNKHGDSDEQANVAGPTVDTGTASVAEC